MESLRPTKERILGPNGQVQRALAVFQVAPGEILGLVARRQAVAQAA